MAVRTGDDLRYVSSTDETPWTPRDLVQVVTVAGAGGIAIVGCWYGISGRGQWSAQLAWMSGGIAALVLALLGMSAWVVVGLRTVKRERRRMHAVRAALVADHLPRSAAPAAATPAAGMVAVVGGTRWHRPDCPLVDGKTTIPADTSGRTASARRPCDVCLP